MHIAVISRSPNRSRSTSTSNRSTDDVETGQLADLTGWGLVGQTPLPVNAVQLQHTETKIVAYDDCENFIDDVTLSETQVCAFKEDGVGACSGDSGGPLVVENKVVGVVSWVDGEVCANGVPEVYTNVYKYLGFINNIIDKK